MIKPILILAACAPLALLAQPMIPNGPAGRAQWMSPRGQGGPILGKPLSGTETIQKTQILADGTHLDTSSNGQFYRDDKGRMRSSSDGFTTVFDAVAGSMFTFMPGANGKFYRELPPVGDAAWAWIVAMNSGAAGSRSYNKSDNPQTATDMRFIAGAEPLVTVSLPSQTMNGVWANGTRITATIPAGAAGNSQPIQIVSEQWYSTDLDVMVQRTTTDPRYGTTTYSLSAIQAGAQDPALFQIPEGYTAIPTGPNSAAPGVKK